MNRLNSAVLTCLLAAGFLSQAAAADPKIAFVNTERIIREAPSAIKAGKKLEREFSQRDEQLKLLASDIQFRQEALAKKGSSISESERRTREREIAELTRELQRKQQEFQEDLNQRQNEETSALIEKANLAIKRIAETENFDLVLQDAVWVGEALDITGKVIKALSGD